jgi:Fic family protein
MSAYKNMSEKLDKLIELVRSKQKKSIDDFERLKNIIRSKGNQISESNQEYLQEVSLQSEKLSVQLDEL